MRPPSYYSDSAPNFVTGMGMAVNLSAFDEAVGIQQAYAPVVDVFSDSGSFWHVAIGASVGMLPELFPGVAAVLFSGYEVSKLAAGESASRVAGAILEFGLGLLLAALYGRYGR